MTDAVTLRLIIDDPVPGVRYSLQKDDMPFEPRTAGDGPMAFEVPITLQPDGRMTGPFVRREGPVRRFVYIRIGTSAGDHAAAWSRRAKIDIHDIPKALLVPDAVLEVHLPGRGKDGSPACATVRPALGWRPV
ncbi:MAG: DUF5990 family protein [Dehalococcoidia bacterium]|uniref:DUF5990 family protein n=1 Tax=Brevundimonas sp. TaxID=1871086 RepID=UPI001836B841|nr:DUF5990 family protein [Brevundimonas sp.]MBU3971237.1 hypothetical protein [Alphaproteobacteria bacterium]MDZ4278002.1 DUF5990 family protein [Dehalococcoidia bacterium]MBA3049989.1 hypothetical protein [Brevundimonas sp.]MBU3974522.1 hypothetical protein [Alphaproteobacteria bacterium]MBU4041236.1 hypothetical protein [Alphaproteobacteria bacterium]